MASGVNGSEICIAYLDATTELGGAEHLLRRLIAGALQMGIKPLVLCPGEGPFPEGCRAQRVEVQIVPFPSLWSTSVRIRGHKIVNPLALLWDLAVVFVAARRIARQLQGQHVALVQTNTILAHVYGALAARWLGVPCVWYFHDLVETRRLAGLTAAFWRWLARALDVRVVAVSQAVLDSLGIRDRGTVIHAGIDQWSLPCPDLRAKLELPPDARLAGYVGRICQGKGLDELAECARELAQNDPHIHVVVFGEALFGEAAYKRNLCEKVERLGLTGRWHWMGYEPLAVMYMRQLDVVVLPSWREAMPLVLLEAGLAGKAVVATRIGGIVEIVVDGETGLLVPARDPKALAEAVLELMRDPQRAATMGQRGHERVLRLFTLPRYYEQYAAFYTAVLGLPHPLQFTPYSGPANQ